MYVRPDLSEGTAHGAGPRWCTTPAKGGPPGGRSITFSSFFSPPKIPRFVNIKNQVEAEVEPDGELGGIFLLSLPPKVNVSLQLFSLNQLQRTSSRGSKKKVSCYADAVHPYMYMSRHAFFECPHKFT